MSRAGEGRGRTGRGERAPDEEAPKPGAQPLARVALQAKNSRAPAPGRESPAPSKRESRVEAKRESPVEKERRDREALARLAELVRREARPLAHGDWAAIAELERWAAHHPNAAAKARTSPELRAALDEAERATPRPEVPFDEKWGFVIELASGGRARPKKLSHGDELLPERRAALERLRAHLDQLSPEAREHALAEASGRGLDELRRDEVRAQAWLELADELRALGCRPEELDAIERRLQRGDDALERLRELAELPPGALGDAKSGERAIEVARRLRPDEAALVRGDRRLMDALARTARATELALLLGKNSDEGAERASGASEPRHFARELDGALERGRAPRGASEPHPMEPLLDAAERAATREEAREHAREVARPGRARRPDGFVRALFETMRERASLSAERPELARAWSRGERVPVEQRHAAPAELRARAWDGLAPARLLDEWSNAAELRARGRVAGQAPRLDVRADRRAELLRVVPGPELEQLFERLRKKLLEAAALDEALRELLSIAEPHRPSDQRGPDDPGTK